MLKNKFCPAPKKLIWFGPPFSYSGYATHNRFMLAGLENSGWEIKLIPTESEIPNNLFYIDHLIEMIRNKNVEQDKAICINLIPPPALAFWGLYTILYTTLESKTVHEGFANRCNQYDEVWVPCMDNITSMSPVINKKIPLCLVPEGVNTEIWNPKAGIIKKYKSPKFTFFYCGDWSYRKGNDILIKAFCKAFSPTEPVRLLLLTHYQGNGPEVTKKAVDREILEMMQKNKTISHAEIEIIYQHIDDTDLPKLFNTVDCGIFPTRGEAWLLPAIQLMSCGKPVITSDWGGQTDYCNKKNSYLIKTEKFDTMSDKINCEVDFYKEQLFAFPDEAETIKLLQYAYQHRDETIKKGLQAQKDVRENWTWTQAAQRADKRLTEILKKL